MRHLVNVGKTNPNKAKVKIGKMNITSFITMNYEQRTKNDEKNKAKTNPNKPNSPSAIRNTQYAIRNTNPNRANFCTIGSVYYL